MAAKRIKWGVIGAGGIARRRTIPEGITKAKNAQLVAIMDVDKKIVEEVGREFEISKCYTKEEDLLKDREVEAVYIATPNYLHGQQVTLASENGKHILCEKSLALTIKDCEKMIASCQRNKVKLGVGFLMRFHAYHQKILEIIKSGKLGEVVMARAQLSCWYPIIEGAWRQDLKKGGGGSLVDMGSHCIDLLEMFIGKVEEVFAFTGNLVQKYEPEDASGVLLRFTNGAIGIVDNYFCIPDNASENRLEIYGSKGSILASGTIGQMPTGKMVLNLGGGGGYEANQVRQEVLSQEIKVTPINMYQAEIEHFSDCITNNKEPMISGSDGLHDQRIILASYKSAKTGKKVTIL
jgi:predicted dehydrogenase